MKKYRLISLVLLGMLLLVAFILQCLPSPGHVTGKNKNLSTLLPGEEGQLIVKNLPLGGTEALNSEVAKTLAYDDYVYRSYQSGGKVLNVLIFYWNPRKIQPRLVSSHTPDACWVRAGMKMVNANTYDQLKWRNRDLIPSQGRVFQSDGNLVYVDYWHLVGGVPFGYGISYQPPWYSMFTDIYKYGLKMRSDQLYVRIHSTREIEEFLRDPAYAPIWEALSKLGLMRDKNL